MALPNLSNLWLEWNKFKESTSVAGQVGVVVVNPDGTTIAGGGSGGQQYVDAVASPAHATGGMLIFNNAGTNAQVTNTQGFPVNVVAGAAGGGAAQLQIRNAADNAWQNVGDGTESATSRYVPVKAADGAMASIGATTDAASASTVIGRLKAILALFPTAAVLADATANPTLTQAASYLMGFNGTTWDRVHSTSGSLNVRLDAQTVLVNGSGVTQPVSGTFWQATQPVSGTFWQATQPVSGTVTTTPPANASTNVAQINGVTPLMGNGVTGTGSLRVTIASDQTQLTNKLLVTPDSVALPANQSVNVSQINAVAPLMGNGVTGTGSQRVTIASDNTAFSVNAVQSGTWTVQPGNTANTTPWLTRPQAATSGGCSIFHLISAATTNLTNVKASAGQVYGFAVQNTNAAARYLCFHNNAGTPTAGAGIIMKFLIPGASAGAGNNTFMPVGAAFATGIAISTVTGTADSDVAAVGLNDLVINVFYS